MKKQVVFLALTLMLFFVGCSKTEVPNSNSEQISIPSSSLKPTVPSEGGYTKISFTTTERWTASVILTKSESWVDVNPKSGSSGDAEIIITTTANQTGAERQATIQIKSGSDTKEIVLTQDAMSMVVENYVDLGLSVKWASCNLGASSPEESGDYYAWGEIEPYYNGDPKNPSWKSGKDNGYYFESYKWCNGQNPNPNIGGKLTKYNTLPEYGPVDNKMMLELEDDAAHVMLGGDWRIPTVNEINELFENCNYKKETINNVVGITFTSKVAGFTNNSIFIPASGLYVHQIIEYFTEEEVELFLRSSSLFHNDPSVSSYTKVNLFMDWDSFIWDISNIFPRAYGMSIRPVCGKVTDATSVSLDKSEMSLKWGESESLTATITPPDATNKSISWQTGDSSIATVDADGNVTASGEGKTTITAYASNGKLIASCSVTVSGLPDFESLVDLGLSVKWASCNLGASSPEDPGDYFAWGEIEPYYNGNPNNPSWKSGKGYSWESNKWCNGKDPDEGGVLTKYNTDSEYGDVDNKLVLEPEDDAAHIILGEKWRMPTSAEFAELVNNCKWDWVTLYGVKGYKVAGKKEGYKDKWIFLPVSGNMFGKHIWEGDGYYWSSSLNTESPRDAYQLRFSPDNIFVYTWMYRYYGCPIRPVSD